MSKQQVIHVEMEISAYRKQFAIFITSNQELDTDDVTSAIEAFIQQNSVDQSCTLN